MKPARVSILDGGTITIDGFEVFWNRGPSGDVCLPVFSVLIDDERGRFLFDSGMDLANTKSSWPMVRPTQTPEQSLTAQLTSLGVAADEICCILNSHFHYDHCGGNKLFPGATIVCHKDEYAQAHHPQPFEKPSYSDYDFDPALAAARDGVSVASDAIPSPEYVLLEGDVEFVPGVWLIETPGHSAGHYSLLVELLSGKNLLFTSDACMTRRHLELMCLGSYHLDPVRGTRSLETLKAVASKYDAQVFFSHSMADFRTYRKAPFWYE